MHDPTPKETRAVRWVSVAEPQRGRRCPHCGAGDLFEIRLRRSTGNERRAAYCAGRYDRIRRRIVSPSCGYAEGETAGAPSS